MSAVRSKPDDFRNEFANLVLLAMRDECGLNGDKFEMVVTTSVCPLIKATFGGQKFNITVTRDRS